MIIVGIILVVIVAILLIRVGVSAEYRAGEGGAVVEVKLGGLKLRVLPAVRTRRKRKKKEKKAVKWSEIREMLPIIMESLGKLRRKLRIDEIRVEYTAGGEDPYRVAMEYGMVSAGVGVLVPVMENNFEIGKREIGIGLDFTKKERRIYIKAEITIRIGTLMGIAIGAAAGIVSGMNVTKKKTKEEEKGRKENGKASDR